ncbi:TauD/TfdA family dioxygenase [Amycolatopsis sp. NPDC059090]|uniref:TauD/TfdA family dioxygenase n=1 Tax=Amycolatopsis sp. NPDC059090 TaxID=3346723 RepID=UPI00366EC868
MFLLCWRLGPRLAARSSTRTPPPPRRLVHDVCPAQRAAHSKTSASSLTALSLHTEDVHHPCRADYVALLCLRNPDSVATSVARMEDAVLSAETRQLLRQDRFRFHPDDSHTGTGALPSTGPVLFGPAVQPYLRFDAEFMSGLDDAAADAIGEVGESLRAAALGVVLNPGDMAFIDNYRVVHGRRAFAAHYDGKDRWLKRVNLARDLRHTYRTREARSRVIG